MTVSKPEQVGIRDQVYAMLLETSAYSAGYKADEAMRIFDAALAALVADRDDARRELAVMAEQLELARQTIADAPHESWCASNDWGNDLHPDDAPPCDCWKVGL